MKTHDISKAKDPDLRASLAAMQRAAKLARKTAIQTNTGIVVVRDGQLVRVSAKELRRQITDENTSSEIISHGGMEDTEGENKTPCTQCSP